jgi:hypothetical protein
MRPTGLAVATLAAFAMAGVAAVAHAAPSDMFGPQDDFTPQQPNTIGPPAPHRSLQWDKSKSRWGLNLDMAQPGDRDLQWRDTRLGVNYRIAPNIRTGVGVALGPEQTPDGHTLDQVGAQPRVRLETSFKF